mgnify:CR=1 FL=1
MKKLIAALLISTPLVSIADVVVLDDHIVDGSQCVGFDCVNGESFGFDTLRLKENNIRINAEDTSSSASFPGNDWRILFNDSANGGANYFAVEDSTAAKVPFKITAGAPTNSLFVHSNGNVGIGTGSPIVETHVADGDSPTLRLEQNGSAGFTPQTWDIAGNETNFFIRDATNGSKLPFKIRPNAPTGSLDLTADGVKVPKISGSVEMTSSSDIELTMSGGITTWVMKNNASTGRLAIQDTTNGTSPLKIFPAASENLIKLGSPAADIIKVDGDIYIKANDGFFVSLRELIDKVEAIEGVDALEHK